MQPLQYDLRSRAAKGNSITNAATARSNLDALCLEKHRVSCICYLSKTHFVRDFLQNSIGNSSTSTTCNPICNEGTILELQITMQFHQQLIHQHHLHPIYNAGTILQLQITMEFCRPHMHEKQLTPHLQCGTDPRMIRA